MMELTNAGLARYRTMLKEASQHHAHNIRAARNQRQYGQGPSLGHFAWRKYSAEALAEAAEDRQEIARVLRRLRRAR